MAALKMNCGETIQLISSAAFRRSPAGPKYPSSSVLRFPAKNSYDGVTAARSNDENENVLKVKEEDGGEVSIMLGKTKMIGPREDVEAAAVRVIRCGSRRKLIMFAQFSIVPNLVFLYILKSNFGQVVRYCKSWYTSVATGSGLTAVAALVYPLFLVALSVAISKPISDKINERLKVMIQEERKKLAFIRNLETRELLKALLEEIKVNPGRIDTIDSETKNLLIKTYHNIKAEADDTGEPEDVHI